MVITTDIHSGLTADRLREILHYNQTTGIFRWRRKIGRGTVVGRIAGSSCKGYWCITIKKTKYMAHRLAWLYVHGVWPVDELDHKDMVKSHNWIDNLRQATDTQNKANRRRSQNNTSGLKGVNRFRNKWRAEIRLNGRGIHLGLFKTPEEAHAAYVIKAAELFGEFANDGA